VQHLIGCDTEAFGEAATTRQDVLRLTVAAEGPIERGIELGERGPLIDRVPAAHHQHDLPARRGQLTPAAVLLRTPHLQDAMRRPIHRIKSRRRARHRVPFPQYSGAMTDHPISYVPSDEVPGIQIAGQPGEVFIVTLDNLRVATDAARMAFRQDVDIAAEPDTLTIFRDNINTLSDAITQLGAEVYNLALGIESGRIAVARD
jgi:hypothetical protein